MDTIASSSDSFTHQINGEANHCINTSDSLTFRPDSTGWPNTITLPYHPPITSSIISVPTVYTVQLKRMTVTIYDKQVSISKLDSDNSGYFDDTNGLTFTTPHMTVYIKNGAVSVKDIEKPNTATIRVGDIYPGTISSQSITTGTLTIHSNNTQVEGVISK